MGLGSLVTRREYPPLNPEQKSQLRGFLGIVGIAAVLLGVFAAGVAGMAR